MRELSISSVEVEGDVPELPFFDLEQAIKLQEITKRASGNREHLRMNFLSNRDPWKSNTADCAIGGVKALTLL